MTFQEFQKMCAKRSKERFRTGDKGMDFWALAIAGEAGELANLVKKRMRGDVMEGYDQKVLKEIADVVTYCFIAFDCMGADAEQEVSDKFDEVNRRLKEKGA